MSIPSILIRTFGLSLAKKMVSIDKKLASNIRKGVHAGSIDGINCESRAKALAYTLKELVADGLKEGRFSLSKNSPFTRLVFGKTTPPMYETGELISHLHIQKSTGCVYRVYWDSKTLLNHSLNSEASGITRGMTWNARNLIDYNSPRRSLRRPSSNKQKQFFKIKAEKSGYTWEQLKQHGIGRAGYITTRRRDFWNIAVRKFIKRYGSLSQVSIHRDNYSVTIRVG